MKLLFIHPRLRPGAGSSITISTIISDLCAENEVAYFSLHPCDEELVHNLAKKGVPAVGGNRNVCFSKLVSLFRFVMKYRPDVVYGFGTNCNFIGLCTAKVAGAKLIVSYRGMLDRLPKRKRLILKYVNAKSDAIIAISNAIRHQLEHDYGADPEKLQVIPPPIEIVPVKNSSFDNRKSLFFVGRLVKGKGALELIEALTMIDEKLKLNIVGEGPMESELKRATKTFGLEDRVFFRGFRPDVISLLSREASLLIVPSKTEGLGRVVLEGFASGVIVVGSSTGGILELIRDGETGYLMQYPPEPAAIAASITRALDDSKNWGLVRESAAKVVPHFSREFVNRRNHELINEIIGASQPPLRKGEGI